MCKCSMYVHMYVYIYIYIHIYIICPYSRSSKYTGHAKGEVSRPTRAQSDAHVQTVFL